jgi:bile acid:Na+ symporter, BASS family
MSIESLIRLGILLSIALIVLSFALRATWGEATSLFRNPPLLARSLLAMNVIMPAFAAVLVGLFRLRPEVEVALIALAVSPVPPFLPLRQMKVAGDREYINGLLGATSLLSIVLTPLTVLLIGLAFSRHAAIDPLKVARVVAITVFLPFAAGLLTAHLKPVLAERLSPLAKKAGSLLLILACLPILIKMWPGMMALIGDGTLLAILVFVAVSVVVGHLLGGPDPADRAVLALATPMRHPGVALVAAASTVGGAKLAAPAVLLYLLVGTLASIPYVRWYRARHRPASAAPDADHTR